MQRWNDDRLDDLSRRVDEHGDHLKALTEILVAQAAIKQQLQDMAEDTCKCLEAVEQVKKELLERDQAQRDREDAQRKERKDDRKVLIATMLTVCSIIVVTLGVFLH